MGRGECVETTRTNKGGDERIYLTARTLETVGKRLEERHSRLMVKRNWLAYGDMARVGEGDVVYWTSDLSISGDGAEATIAGGVKTIGVEANPDAAHYLRAHAAGIMDGVPKMQTRGGGSGSGAFVLTRLKLWNMRRLYAGAIWSGAQADAVLGLSDGAAISFEARPSIRRFRRRTGAEGAELAFAGIRFDKLSDGAPVRVQANAAVAAADEPPLKLPWAV